MRDLVMHLRSISFVLLVMGCGGGSASTATATTTPGAPRLVGACHTPSLGVCQLYYEGEAGIDDARAACTNSAVPGTTGSWLADCPSGDRLGDCTDVNGNVQARFYSGSAQYPDAESAENACEAGSGTWVP